MVTFDTLKASHRLREAGFEEQKANALVNAFAEDIGANLATKDDIAILKGDIDTLRKDTANGFEALRQEMASGDEAIRKDMANEIASVRKDMASGFELLRQEMTSENESIRKDMAMQEERLNARMDRQTTRITLLVAGMAGLILTAIGIATGILATL